MAGAEASAASSELGNGDERRRLRVLCFHGFRTSAVILQRQIELAKWGAPLLELMDLSFLDAPLPSEGRSGVEGKFDPPYYEWFRSDLYFTEYYGVEECISYVSDYMKLHGPFDGLLGFSQGGFLAGILAGYQDKVDHLLPTRIKFVIILAGGVMRYKKMASAFETPIKCPSLHTIGAKDFNRASGEVLQQKFENPVVLRNPHNHRVPPLDEDSIQQFRSFLLEMIKICAEEAPETRVDEELSFNVAPTTSFERPRRTDV